MTLPNYADQLGSISAFSYHFADLKWLSNAAIPCDTSNHCLCEALNYFKKTQTQKLLMDTGMIQRTQQDHCEGKQTLQWRLTHVKMVTLAKQTTTAFVLSLSPQVK